MKRNTFIRNSILALPAFSLKDLKAINSTSKPFVVKAGTSRSGKAMMKYAGLHPNDVIISKKDTDGAASVFLFIGNDIVGTPLHIHFEQDEYFTVIEGKYRFVCGDLKTELEAGDSIFLPRKIAHQWLQISKKGKLIYAVTPAGELEDFFEEVNALKAPSIKEIDALALKHGVQHIGPPLEL
ncbi:MAG: cupin domain-containing protein [Flavitalea sp.]